MTGFTIGVTGHRRAAEQAEMLVKRGATVVVGSVMQSVPLDDIEATLAATKRILDDPVDCIVLTTGVGTRSWIGVTEIGGIDDDLRRAAVASLVLARGPKARSAAIGAGLDVTWQAPEETGAEIVRYLAELGVAGKRIAVQRDGGVDLPHSLATMIEALGAEVVEVPVYRWTLPDDVQPAKRLIGALLAGRLDAVTFTSAIAVDNLFELSPDEEAVAKALSGPGPGQGLAVAVGPVTADALVRHGCRHVIEPTRARLGAMVQAVVATLAERGRMLSHDGVTARVQGLAVAVEGRATATMTAREAHVLAVLLRRSPAVVAKSELIDTGSDNHAAEMTVTRLRVKLGPLGDGIVAIPRRGYRCVLEVADLPIAQ